MEEGPKRRRSWNWLAQAIAFVLILLPSALLAVFGYSQLHHDLQGVSSPTGQPAADFRLLGIIYAVVLFFNAFTAYLMLRLIQLMSGEQERERAFLESIGDGVFGTDAAGVILYINPAAEELLGWTSAEVIGKKFSADMPKALDDKGQPIPFEERATRQALLGKNRVNKVYSYVRKDGTKFFATVTAAPVMVRNRVVGAVTVFRDRTQWILLDRAKSEFVSVASHQLRTPLTSMRWFLDLLTEDLSNLTPEQRDYFSQIREVNQNMVEIVEGLLNVARLELGTYAVEPVPVRLDDVVESVIGELEPQLREKNIKIEKVFAQTPAIPADRGMLHMVFQNLIGNAVKYGRKNGHVKVSIETSPDYAFVNVTDDGLGIPAEQQSQIFNKMFRADNVHKMEGTGLGLYVAKSIIDLAGGRIWFESEEGKGTTFHLQLPFAGMRKKEGSTHVK